MKMDSHTSMGGCILLKKRKCFKITFVHSDLDILDRDSNIFNGENSGLVNRGDQDLATWISNPEEHLMV
jgi:hypothetical protein